jgi:IS30 family transposase
MSSYSQLSLEERCSIARLREAGQSIRQIAAALDRQPSTISRELSRNSGSKVGYRPGYAQAQAGARRWHGARLEREDVLREEILNRLGEGWSPEQIAGRLAHQAGHQVISHETIYRFVYAQLKRTNERRWRLYLPRAKYKRGRRNKGGGWPRIADRCSIHDRPHDIATRQVPGHWEADGMLFSTPGKAILVAHERQSRLTIAMPQQNLKADPVAAALTRMLRSMPPTMRRSITFDNGTEFARHHHIARQLGLQTFFCDPHAPWQKGGIENAIGRLRRDLPRKTDLNALPRSSLDAIIARHNNTPRKCLGFQTPAEAFLNSLHFECESTPGTRPA